MEFTHNKRWIFGLLVNCPLGKSQSSCPLNELRLKTVDKLLEFVDDLSIKDTESIIKYHKNCLIIREKK